jgi:hypothetical protein
MSETFSFRAAPQPLRRRVDPRAVKAAALAFGLVLVLGTFARWVIDSERASEAAASRAERSAAVEVPAIDVVADPRADREARMLARASLRAASRLFDRSGSLAGASPAALSSLVRRSTFVDGPSTASGIVSVSATSRAWAAAVRSDSGTCFYIRVASGGGVTYGTGTGCTGTAALDAADRAWRP